MEGKYIAGIAAILVAVILVGSVLAPIIDTVSGGAWDETVTTTYNEDPDLQFDKQTSDFALNMSVTIGDDVTITNGEDTVTAPYGAMFLLAADNSAVFISAADDLIFTWSDNDGKHSVNLVGDFTAVIADDKLTINDGTAHDAPLPASYLYVPSSTGGYGSFASGELAKRAADPVIAAGSFAGAVAYNSSVTLVGDAMVMSVDGTDTLVNSVEWVAAPEAEPSLVPFDPSSITIQPLDPSVISLDPEPSMGTMSVGTPDYTDGDWGYKLTSGGTKAYIVSYSGTGGGPITVPSTVGGYDVIYVGDTNNNVIDPSVTGTDLIISEGITQIRDNAFQTCNKLTGNLVLPDSLQEIGSSAFYGCSGLTDDLIIPENVSTIGMTAFRNCSGLGSTLVIKSTSLALSSSMFRDASNLKNMVILTDTITQVNNAAFSYSSIKNILALGTFVPTTTSYGLNADTIQDYIGADVYLAPATITEVIHHSGGGGGGMGAMYAAIPVVILAAILLAAVSMFVIRRGM